LVIEVFHTHSFADSGFAAGIAGVTAGWAGSATTFMRFAALDSTLKKQSCPREKETQQESAKPVG